ncbi:hypothetical protein SAMN05216227_100492 [Pseudorhodobacter antarcticus]|jgi:hypothetical protein|uniref:Uncharacterized protein n=1 Tax=Pseudorhodobacter antarcticus TaxID=1077947 RepID=A0A1H8C7Y4_9RHOB|nr:hypothetical protein [Pseudorhodobacter antarcticus]SEM91175.1 hypothetical protein SAMN05216227_100492 [Pseudorhodobacter antarcticus]
MTVEMIDGVRVMRLNDHATRTAADDDMMTMVHLWRLLSGDNALRDATIAPRRYL